MLSAAGPAGAESQTAPRMVELFDQLCLELMPNLGSVTEAATAAKWNAVTGKGLDPFKPPVEPKVIKAWSFVDKGETLSLAITQSDLDEQAKADFPAFASGQSYACSLVLPADKTKPADVTGALASVMARAHDDSYEDGPWFVSTWSGITDERVVFIYHYAPKAGDPGGLLSLVMFEKE